MRIRYTLRAFADRESIYDYLEKRSPQGARNVKRAIVQAIDGLATYPRIGRLTDKPDVYELIVPRRPYKVYYRIERDDVWIMHIRDARRRPWSGEGD
jgi:plasmid stabilization system protein ParE